MDTSGRKWKDEYSISIHPFSTACIVVLLYILPSVKYNIVYYCI